MGGGADRGIVQKHRVPYTIQLSTRRSGFGGGPPDLTNTNRFGFGEPMDSASTNRLGGVSMDPTSTNWVDNVRQMFTWAAQTIKDDPWCIGFFVDNEIHASTNPAWFESYYRQVGALAKETFVPLSALFVFGWWISISAAGWIITIGPMIRRSGLKLSVRRRNTAT